MDNFIKYKDYGYNLTYNLIFSYLVGWGNKGTYASNKEISNRTKASVPTITRALNRFQKDNHIEISNPNGRSRFIRVINQPNHSDELPNHNDEGPNHSDEDNLIMVMNNKKDDKIINEIIDNTIIKSDYLWEKKDYEQHWKMGKRTFIDEIEITSDNLDELFTIKF